MLTPTSYMPTPKRDDRKHEALPFRKVMLLALERCGRETKRLKRNSERYENMAQLALESGINRTVIPNIRDGITKEPTRDTFQKMSQWLLLLHQQGNPIKDENGIAIAYEWNELELLDQRAKDLDLDENDPYLAKYDEEENPKFKKKKKRKTPAATENSLNIESDDFLEDPDAVAAAIEVLQHHLRKAYKKER